MGLKIVKELKRVSTEVIKEVGTPPVDLSSPLFQRDGLLSYLGGGVRVWGKSEIGLKVLSSKIYESLEAP